MWASSVSAPTRSARISRLPVPLTRAADDLGCRLLLHRDRFAGDHGLIDARCGPRRRRRPPAAFSPGRTRSTVAGLHQFQRHVLLPGRRAGPAAPSSGPGRAAGGRRRWSGCAPAVPAPAPAAPARSPRPPSRNRAGRRAFGGRDRAAMLNRYAAPTPRAMSVNMLGLSRTTEAPARCKNGQPHQRTTGVASSHCSHADIESVFVSRMGSEHFEDVQSEQRQGQDEADPEATGHVHQFGIRPLIGGDGARFQGHAALGARTGAVADHLGVHRTDVFDLGSWRRQWGRRRRSHRLLGAVVEVTVRVGLEFHGRRTGCKNNRCVRRVRASRERWPGPRTYRRPDPRPRGRATTPFATKGRDDGLDSWRGPLE